MKLESLAPVFVLVIATLFFAYDIVSDVLDGDESSIHLVIESVVFLAVSFALYRELQRLIEINQALAEEKNRTARLSGELLTVMQNQFAAWELSPSERDVALLLIKGLSMKEIALARSVKEKTIRQQAANIYAKCGYGGRHELAAHFIEDLMRQSPELADPAGSSVER